MLTQLAVHENIVRIYCATVDILVGCQANMWYVRDAKQIRRKETPMH